MEETYETIEYRGFNINVICDIEPMNPITEWDMLGKMVCWHSRYYLGHEQPTEDAEEYAKQLAIDADPSIEDKIEYWDNGNGWVMLSNKQLEAKATDVVFKAVEESDKRVNDLIQNALSKHYIILPLYLYDHSGITISTSSFSCPWDSGQVGYIYVSIKQVKEEWGRKNMSYKFRKQIIDHLVSNVEVYDQYLTGDVYGFQIEPKDTNKHIDCDDSCWGFFGSDHEKNGLLEHAKPAIDYAIKDYKKQVIENYLERKQTAKFMRECWAD